MFETTIGNGKSNMFETTGPDERWQIDHFLISDLSSIVDQVIFQNLQERSLTDNFSKVCNCRPPVAPRHQTSHRLSVSCLRLGESGRFGFFNFTVSG